MYLEYYGFVRSPFQIAPDEKFLYLSPKHAKALVYMDYAAKQPDGFVIVTGEIGSGKSTLIKRLLKRLQNKTVCFNLQFTNLKNNELLNYIARQANLEIDKHDKISILYSLTQYFNQVARSGRASVLVIDEAQNLSQDNLEDIRMLAGLEGADGHSLLRVVLLGQPEFMKTVNNSEQLKQRVKLHYHLTGLDEPEVEEYIKFRLEVAGYHGKDDLFNYELVKAIHRVSKGIPRVINKVCDTLLMCAFSENKTHPDVSDVEEISKDLMILENDADSELTQETDLKRIADALESIESILRRAIPETSYNKNVSPFRPRAKK